MTTNAKDLRRAKLKFVSMPIIKAMEHIKCGFELETQSVNGKTMNEMSQDNSSDRESHFDEDGFSDYCREQAQNRIAYADQAPCRIIKAVLTGESVRVLSGLVQVSNATTYGLGKALFQTGKAWLQLAATASLVNIQRGTRLYAIAERVRELALENESAENTDIFLVLAGADLLTGDIPLIDMINSIPENDQPHDENDIEDMVYDKLWDSADRSDFYNSSDDDDGDYDSDGDNAQISTPAGVTWKTDGSVTGPEFITAGQGTTASLFSSSLRKLFGMHDLEIDRGCSFHIHVSVNGIKHKYGKLFQAYLMEYLLSQAHRVPVSVKERWSHDTNYFKPQISTEKYSFVHYHQNLGTWEFRCFGNVNNHADGMRCLKLAVEAMQYAYKVQLKRAKSSLAKPGDWSSYVLADVLMYKLPVQTAIKERKALSGRDDEESAAA